MAVNGQTPAGPCAERRRSGRDRRGPTVVGGSNVIARSGRNVTAGSGRGRTLRVCALYPDLMNIYADRGNLLVLERRCAWRGIAFELAASGIGQKLDGRAHDIYYIGGGQDRDQRLCATDLLEGKREALHQAAARGAIVLGICGGYQLLGRAYVLGDDRIEGVGLLDVDTVRTDAGSGAGAGADGGAAPSRARGPSLRRSRKPRPAIFSSPAPTARLIGNVAIDISFESRPGAAPDTRRVLAGFENHGGRTRLGPHAQPLGRVIEGYGNDGYSGHEGARAGSVIGTYMHGPLLPKNTWFADWLIAMALGLGIRQLERLDDELERQAHVNAREAAGF